MTKQQWRIIVGINLLTGLTILSPFLPGPSFLSGTTNLIFSLLQLVSIFGLILIPIGLLWNLLEIIKVRKQANKKQKVFPILLWTIPLILITNSIWVAEAMRDFSRKFAISNAGNLIAAIESFNRDNNEYPDKIEGLSPKYLKRTPSPWIMGIPEYSYNKKNDSFNLTFSQNVIIGFNFEVVVYDPTENHKAEGELTTLYETGKDKWKYYIYD